MVIAIRDLINRVNHYVDRSDLHTEKLRTCIEILQQVEACQHLMIAKTMPEKKEKPKAKRVMTSEKKGKRRLKRTPSD